MFFSIFIGHSRNFRPILSRSASNLTNWRQPSGEDTGIVIYNCIQKQKVPLFLQNDVATWYSCGPTVYDSSHIGHASCYVKLDIIQRILVDYFKIDLITAMGVTDIDDKIINRAKNDKTNWKALSRMYEDEFWQNMDDLNVIRPDFVLRVTDNMNVINDFIKGIDDRNLCYTAKDKSVYFDTERYGKYGKLQAAQNEINSESIEKKSPADFALWKAHKEGEPSWKSNWGDGRPGWHIECSAMVSRLFGKTVDFHAGGIDLQFPHHENEEAQSCAFHNTDQWVNYWIHTGHLHLNNDVKMSKSLKNTVSIDDLLKSHTGETFRMACLMSHYRYQMEYTDNLMNNAKAIIDKITYLLKECDDYLIKPANMNPDDEFKLQQLLHETKRSIDGSLCDDFDTSKCIMHLSKLVKETNRAIKMDSIDDKKVIHNTGQVTIASISKYIKFLMKMFGIEFDNQSEDVKTFSGVVNDAVEFRNNVRRRALEIKDGALLKECDKLRDALKNKHIYINDKSDAQSLWILKK